MGLEETSYSVRATEYIIRRILLTFKASGVHEIPRFDQDSLRRMKERERERNRPNDVDRSIELTGKPRSNRW